MVPRAMLNAMTTIYSWNVNGIRAVLRKGAFQEFMAAESPDIACLQETKAQPGQAEFDLPEYHEYWHSANKPGYSGTAILSKQPALSTSLGLPPDIQQRYDMTTDGYGDPNAEGRVLVAEYPAFYLVTVYTPNAKDDLSRVPLRRDHWDPAFLAYCRRLEETKPVVFCGDLNVAHTELDHAHPQANRGKKGFTDEERAGFEAFLAAGFVDTFRMFEQDGGHYTWWSNFTRARERNVGWRIDYFLVSAQLRDRITAASIYPQYMGSDHCPISVTLDV
jgi:exodeoxyribonuclease-3